MSTNILLNTDLMASESLMHFDNELVFAKLIDREWEDKFGREGAKINDSIRLRKALNFEVRTGQKFNPQAIQDRSTTLVLDTPLGVDLVTDSNEQSLSIDKFGERIAKPAMRRLANKVDGLIGQLYKKVSTSVGTYDAAPTGLANFTDARAKLNALGVPDEDRHFVLDPITEGVSIAFLSTLFNPQDTISAQTKKGRMGRALGAEFHMGQNVGTHIVGTLGSVPLANAAAAQTGASIICDGAGGAVPGYLKEGDLITFAGVNAVNPITGDDLGFLREFVVTADVDSDGGGNFTVPIDPPVTISGPYKTSTIGVVNNAVILIFGHASNKAGLVARQCMYFQKEWATLAIAPQAVPRGTHNASMAHDPDGGGIGIRYICDYDIDDNVYKHRWDIYLGLLAPLPEFALRIHTT